MQMRNYDKIDFNNLSGEVRHEMLLEMIPKLKRFRHLSGSEGTAYSVGESLIVKEYDKVANRDLLDSIFEAYCDESRAFAEKGYLLPQIYAWTKIPAKKSFLIPTEDRYFVLEEKVKGRELFFGKLEQLYYLFDEEYSYRRFAKILNNPELDIKLYHQIVKSYIADFIRVNSFIEAMPESELEHFIMSIYKMYESAEYSIPDINRRNVLMTDKGLRIIDNFMAIKTEHSYFGILQPDDFLASVMILLFRSNVGVNEIVKKPHIAGTSAQLTVESMIQENQLICQAAIEKILRVMKKCLEGRDINNYRVLHTAYNRLSRILDYQKASKVVSILNKNYLGM